MAKKKRQKALQVTPDEFCTLERLLGTAITQLGRLSSYPNKVLANLISFEKDSDDEVDQAIVDIIRSTAYGAYITTATDFSTGRNAGNEIEAKGIKPNLEMAERFISDWG